MQIHSLTRTFPVGIHSVKTGFLMMSFKFYLLPNKPTNACPLSRFTSGVHFVDVYQQGPVAA